MTDAATRGALAVRPRASRWLGLGLAGVVLYLALIQPNHPDAVTWRALAALPLELPLILLGLAALPPRWRVTALVRAMLVVLLVASVVLGAADLATRTALHRAFHPLLDLHLLVSGWRLGRAAVGDPLMAAAVLAALAVAALAAVLLWWATGRWAALDLAPATRRAAVLCAGLAAVAVVAETGQDLGRWRLPFDPPGDAFATRVAVERVAGYRAAAADLAAFREAAASDPWTGVSPLLDRIGDRDVLVVFVESYGAASLGNPRYAPTHRATLAAIQRGLEGRGVAMRSAWLDAPTFGGQSWLSHTTLASGLRVDDQQSYGAYLASPRRGLFHLAQGAGFRTAAVMPAITLDWPEAGLMGFDLVLAADALGYRGPSFNWVTMPDQFTLAALDRLVRDAEGPVFAQVALVSSHAPWVPVPEVVPWEDVGDGTVFAAQAAAGDPPEVVWRDPDRIREQYRRAVDYSLSAVGAYAGLHAGDPPLMVVLGDHPPARFVAEDESDAVPSPCHRPARPRGADRRVGLDRRPRAGGGRADLADGGFPRPVPGGVQLGPPLIGSAPRQDWRRFVPALSANSEQPAAQVGEVWGRRCAAEQRVVQLRQNRRALGVGGVS